MCQQVSAAPNPLAKEELNLLARLMGGLEVQKPGNADTGFRISLFATDEEEEWVSICIRCNDFITIPNVKNTFYFLWNNQK